MAAAPFRLLAAIGRALLFLIKGRPVIAPLSIQRERMLHCAGCEMNENGLCTICCCLIDAKAMISSEECPDNPPRWKRVAFSK